LPLPSHEDGTFPVPWHMPQGAFPAHRLGTLGLAGHSNRPRPPHPGHGTLFSRDEAFFMAWIPPS